MQHHAAKRPAHHRSAPHRTGTASLRALAPSRLVVAQEIEELKHAHKQLRKAGKGEAEKIKEEFLRLASASQRQVCARDSEWRSGAKPRA